MIDSSLRQVIVVPAGTVIVDGSNISELKLMTGPAGVDAALLGAVGDGAAWALQPARPPAMSSEAMPMRTLRRIG